ncbi:glycosyltransferase family protein [Rhodoblastus sp.]|uniref:glycosyltransferase family protein n=1 Tax=Rhodoblastus sp. TaxID=1962975 RepID=UPI003F966EF9
MTKSGALEVFVLLGRRLDVHNWSIENADGICPDKTPYGFHNAEAMNCKVSYSEPTKVNLIGRVVKYVFKCDILHVLANWRRLRTADVVWTMTESEFLALRILERTSFSPKKPLIGQVIWLISDWKSYSSIRRWFVTKLLRDTSVLTVHSKCNLPILKEVVPEGDVRLLLFGISIESFPLTTPTGGSDVGPIRIFAPGGDKTRDWQTLFEAFGDDRRFEVVVAIRHMKGNHVSKYSNFREAESKTLEGFRREYYQADFVLVPMIENPYSGITVALEAASSGAAIICSDTGGVPSYFDAREVLYVPPGRPVAMRNAALSMNARQRREMALRAQQRFIRDEYTSKAMAQRYVSVSKEILGVD